MRSVRIEDQTVTGGKWIGLTLYGVCDMPFKAVDEFTSAVNDRFCAAGGIYFQSSDERFASHMRHSFAQILQLSLRKDDLLSLACPLICNLPLVFDFEKCRNGNVKALCQLRQGVDAGGCFPVFN